MEEGTEDSVHRDAWLRKMNGGRRSTRRDGNSRGANE